METRSRLAATAVFVLAALCGTSLAVSADTDRPAPPAPELPSTSVAWVADSALGPIAATAEDLAWAARDAVNSLESLDVNSTRAAISRGDVVNRTLTAQLAELNAYSPAAAQVAELPGTWQTIRTRALGVANLLSDLEQHDNSLIRAAGYGRQSDWTNALAYLAQAETYMSRVQADRDSLGPAASMPRLGDLMIRYDTYGAALTALYQYMSKGHGQHGKKFARLNGSVTTAQAALPVGRDVFSAIVDEAGGTALTASLAAISRVRADIDAVLNPPIQHAQ